MWTKVKHLLELIRFSHTIFALPFALLAAVMAIAYSTGELRKDRLASPYRHDSYMQIGPWTIPIPDWMASTLFPSPRSLGDVYSPPSAWGPMLLGVLFCMVFARGAAMAFNRIVDWRIDAVNPRTERRHIPAGILSLGTVFGFFAICATGFIASTLLFLPNYLPLVLAVPVLLFLCGYSYAKRFTSLAHFWLGAALMLAPICRWIALRGEVVLRDPADLLPAVILGGAVMLWVAGFDMIYACQDAVFDTRAGLHSIPAKWGVPSALRLSAVCHASMVLLLAVLPLVYPLFGTIYWVGVAAIAGLLVYEHAIVRADDLSRVNVAFFNVNAVVSIGLLIVGVMDLIA